MLFQATLPGLPSAIFSPASAFGAMPCAKLDGPMTGQCGQEVVLASHSAVPERAKDLKTSVTCGPNFTVLSASAALQRALESRLQAKTASLGSSLYKITWKVRVTPSGRLIPALRASVRRTSGKDYTGWPTPTLTDYKGGYSGGRIRNGKLSTDRLDVTAQLTGWPTPTTQDDNCSRMPNPQEYAEKRLARANKCSNLAQTAQAFAHNTPARLTATGEMLTGSCAGMGSGGQLNPALSRWLMGLPPEWDDCAVMAMQSMPSKRKRS